VEVTPVRTTIRGKNLSVAEADREYVERKMQRLARILDDRSEAVVEFQEEQSRSAEHKRIVEVTLSIDGRPLRGVASAATYRAAVDEVVDKLERRAVEFKERPRDRARSAEARTAGQPGAAPGEVTDDTLVVKVKRFAIEPMFEEDAVSRMEELGHTFFIFVNAENERVAVLYRRRDGRYGLIEPTIGGGYTRA
jgi:putative sigma-54 modulation protein